MNPGPSGRVKRQARTVSVRAATKRVVAASKAALSTTVKRDSASIESRSVEAAIVMGSKLASVTVPPTFGGRTSTATAGTSAGSTTGPRTRIRCVSVGWPGASIENTMTLSPSVRPLACIGATGVSTRTSKRRRASPRESVIAAVALAAIVCPPTGRSAANWSVTTTVLRVVSIVVEA